MRFSGFTILVLSFQLDSSCRRQKWMGAFARKQHDESWIT